MSTKPKYTVLDHNQMIKQKLLSEDDLYVDADTESIQKIYDKLADSNVVHKGTTYFFNHLLMCGSESPFFVYKE